MLSNEWPRDIAAFHEHLRAAADAARELEKATWKDAVRIARDYPVSVEHVRAGLDYIRERSALDGKELSATETEAIVTCALEHALVIGEPYAAFRTFYIPLG